MGEVDRHPGPLAVFYGWPSLVNGAGGDPSRAAEQFAGFEAVVFGDATPTVAGDPRGAAVARRLRGRCRVLGYLSLGVGPGQPGWAPAAIRRRLALWAEWGAGGMLLDCAGRDFGVAADRLALAVAAVHQLEMDVAVNAWDPDDLLASGSRFGPADAYLAENDVLRHGELRPPGAYAGRLAAVERVRRRLGLSIWATATTATLRVPPGYGTGLPRLMARSWAAAGARPPRLLAVADPLYGAADNRLALPEPARLPAAAPGAGRPHHGETAPVVGHYPVASPPATPVDGVPSVPSPVAAAAPDALSAPSGSSTASGVSSSASSASSDSTVSPGAAASSAAVRR